MTTIVYDFESTGVDTRFDQPTQFAAVVMDDSGREIDSINIRARRMKGIIPAPGALATTGIPGEQLDAEPRSHYEMMREISQFLEKHTPAEIYGYNSVKFDEEMMRSSFRRTLQPMFQTTGNGNTRGDVINLATAVALLHPEALQIPVKDNGRESFKLTDITNANGVSFDESTAHDALADVRATASFLKFLQDKDPALAQRMHQNMTRDGAEKTLTGSDVVVEGARYFGRSYTYALTHLVQNPDYKSQHAVIDLARIDQDKLAEIAEMSPEQLKAEMNRSPRILRKLRTNGHPAIAPYEEISEGARAGLPPEEVLRERAALVKETLANHPTFRANLQEALATQYMTRTASPYVGKGLNLSLLAEALPADLDALSTMTPKQLRAQLKGLPEVLERHGRAVDPDAEEDQGDRLQDEAAAAAAPAAAAAKASGRRRKAGAKPGAGAAEPAAARTAAATSGETRTAALREKLQQNPAFLANLRDAIAVDYQPEPSSPHVELRIYDRWVGRDDQNVMAYFHEVPWTERAELMNRFEDPDLREIAREILYDQDPALLPEADQRAEAEKIRRRFEAPAPEERGVQMPRSVEMALADGEKMLHPSRRSSKAPVEGEKKAATEAAMAYVRDTFEGWEPPAVVPQRQAAPGPAPHAGRAPPQTPAATTPAATPAAAAPAAGHKPSRKSGAWTRGLDETSDPARPAPDAPKPRRNQDYAWKL